MCEDVEDQFEATEGYVVDAVRINDKMVVSAKVEDTSGIGLTYRVEQTTQDDANRNKWTVLHAAIQKVAGKNPKEEKGPYVA
ncbi:hypothetical protein [Streptococcus ovuberis]|uniref:Uncharacterized protein n=1 Tax=Streptococcus ovuberis TaxID=1936207 RepID=A0A7X6S253_9STRE|nr:hypothetical protein [Streptococcus ovuberis]NKZ20881.1 hypothetical protein [Streptococcus ovuberis]